MSDTIDTLIQVVSDLSAQNKSLHDEVRTLQAEIEKLKGSAAFLENLRARTKEEAKVCCINWIKEYRNLADIPLKGAKDAVENRLKELNIYPF